MKIKEKKVYTEGGQAKKPMTPPISKDKKGNQENPGQYQEKIEEGVHSKDKE